MTWGAWPKYYLAYFVLKWVWKHSVAVVVGLPWLAILRDCSPIKIGDRKQTCTHI